jgi:pantetheine-phosphate adenylyltransferase
MNKKAIYPGSFDPPTNGHIDLIERGLTIFDEIIIVVIVNPSKKTLFSVEERKDIFQKIYGNNDRIRIDSYEGLLVDYAASCGITTVLRGLRAVSDFEYEFQMALMNRELKPDVNSVYLMPSRDYAYLSSSLVKEVYSLGGDISNLVPSVVEEFLSGKYSGR